MIRIHDIKRADEKASFTLVQRPDGLYTFGEEQELADEVPGVGPYNYWATTYTSGIHDNLADAEREARTAIPWLRDAEVYWSSDDERE
ncbi:MAG: hypothetical protein ABW206_08775 [Agrobacterium vaccinii]